MFSFQIVAKLTAKSFENSKAIEDEITGSKDESFLAGVIFDGSLVKGSDNLSLTYRFHGDLLNVNPDITKLLIFFNFCFVYCYVSIILFHLKVKYFLNYTLRN